MERVLEPGCLVWKTSSTDHLMSYVLVSQFTSLSLPLYLILEDALFLFGSSQKWDLIFPKFGLSRFYPSLYVYECSLDFCFGSVLYFSLILISGFSQ